MARLRSKRGMNPERGFILEPQGKTRCSIGGGGHTNRGNLESPINKTRTQPLLGVRRRVLTLEETA